MYPELLDPLELDEIADCPLTLLDSEKRSFSGSSRIPSGYKKIPK